MIHEANFRLKRDGTLCKRGLCTKPELIENYEKAIADKTQTWECHHRLETHTSDGERRLVDISPEELIALDMYYHRPASELIFLTKKEHKWLHQKGKPFSKEHKRKITEAKKGKKREPRSEEHRKHLSEALKDKHWKLVDGKRVWY